MMRRTKRVVNVLLLLLLLVVLVSLTSSESSLSSSCPPPPKAKFFMALIRLRPSSAVAIEFIRSSITPSLLPCTFCCCCITLFLDFTLVPYRFSVYPFGLFLASARKSCGSTYTHNPLARNTTGRLVNRAHGTSNWTLSNRPSMTLKGHAKLGANIALRDNSEFTACTSSWSDWSSILPDQTATFRDSESRLWTYLPMVLSRTSRMAFLAMVGLGWVWCVNYFILPSFDNVSMVTAGELRYVRNIKVLLSAMMMQLDVHFWLLL
mmetsp:Transcript_12477/g.24922  ORF Transcript_12477/g.24922 Transcript_12477/m.24922 type:complete len:264 (-) Transcript_12477:31-822(-)